MKQRRYACKRERAPRWLRGCLGRGLFDWMLINYTLHHGRLETNFVRKSPYRYTADGAVKRHRIYDRPGLLASVCFLWMLAWSRMVEDETS